MENTRLSRQSENAITQIHDLADEIISDLISEIEEKETTISELKEEIAELKEELTFNKQ